MRFRHDDPINLRKENIKFIDERIGFVYMGWMLAVTIDGGDKWSIWDASKIEFLKDKINYDLISDVTIDSNGQGIMTLNLLSSQSDKKLFTEDYGISWHP